MSREYAVLVAPSANRVYAAEAARLAAAELRWLAEHVGALSVSAEPAEIAGVDYVVVRANADDGGDSGKAPSLSSVIGASSSAWALFAREGDLLRPIPLARRRSFPDDVVTIPKYTGKTNEQFTQLLLGLTLAACRRPDRLISGSARVLDPVCGRGTTLSTALLLGFDAVGVDVDRKSIELYSSFLKTWAKTHRLPHTHEFGRLRRDKRTIGERLEFSVAPDRAAQKAGAAVSLTAYAADTTHIGELVRPGSVDVIVGDLPYGVLHGSHRGHDLDRRPAELVRAALDGWRTTLRDGGSIGLSFNAKTLSPAELSELLIEHGFEVVDGCAEFSHRVDASIQRELLVARRSAD